MAGGVAKNSAADKLSAAPSFAAATAAITGADARTVRRDAERGEKVADEALDLIQGTALDTGHIRNRVYWVDIGEEMRYPEIRIGKSPK